MEAERNRIQGNRVISVWKVRHGHGHGCLVKHIASRWDANNNNGVSALISAPRSNQLGNQVVSK